MDMGMGNMGAAHGHLGTPSSPRRLPLGVSLPSLPCSRDSHALSRFQPALPPGPTGGHVVVSYALPLPVLVNLPTSWLHVPPAMPCSC